MNKKRQLSRILLGLVLPAPALWATFVATDTLGGHAVFQFLGIGTFGTALFRIGSGIVFVSVAGLSLASLIQTRNQSDKAVGLALLTSVGLFGLAYVWGTGVFGQERWVEGKILRFCVPVVLMSFLAPLLLFSLPIFLKMKKEVTRSGQQSRVLFLSTCGLLLLAGVVALVLRDPQMRALGFIFAAAFSGVAATVLSATWWQRPPIMTAQAKLLFGLAPLVVICILMAFAFV